MSRTLVTGSEGFVGRWLVKELHSRGEEVFGYDIKNGHDINDYAQLSRTINLLEPQQIFHLAAVSSVPLSIKQPRLTVETNVQGTVNVLEASRGIKVLLASTGHAETDSSPYTASKLAMEAFGRIYPNVVITRAHNHAGPGQSDEYAVASFAKQVALIEKGEQDKIVHGNLASVRNYTDVRDIVRAYTELIDSDPGTYEVASDNNLTMEAVLNGLVALSTRKIELEYDKNLDRGETIFKAHGRFGSVPFEQTLTDTLDYWRKVCAS